jgi:hypothetical protein
VNFHERLTKGRTAAGSVDLRDAPVVPPRITQEVGSLVITGETPKGQRVRPSDWTTRLTGMAAAHANGAGMPDVTECRACGDRRCIRIGASVPRLYPGLFTDIQLFVRVADATDYSGMCPKLKDTSVDC